MIIMLLIIPMDITTAGIYDYSMFVCLFVYIIFMTVSLFACIYVCLMMIIVIIIAVIKLAI